VNLSSPFSHFLNTLSERLAFGGPTLFLLTTFSSSSIP
jgi:hypothetical protein